MSGTCGHAVRRRGDQLPCLLPFGHDGMHVARKINQESEKRQQANGIRTIRLAELGKHEGQGQCARCRTYTTVDGHELYRGSRRNHARPDVLLCRSCHEFCTTRYKIACWTGWAISPKHSHDPALQNGQALDLYGCIVQFTNQPVVDEDVPA